MNTGIRLLSYVKYDDSKIDDDTWKEPISPVESTKKGLVETTKDIEIQGKDPNSPLYSVKTFETLHLKPALLKGIYNMGFKAPLRIQEIILPTALADPPQNIIAYSHCGTGKTVACVLAMLNRIDPRKKYPQVLYLSTTYELAIQAGELVAKMSRFCTEINIKYAVKGEKMRRGSNMTEHIVIGTLGKVLDWRKNKFFDLDKISVFAMDDIPTKYQVYQDHCMSIRKLLPSTCQMMVFSTMYIPEVTNFAEIIVSNPLIIRLLERKENLDNIEQYYIKCKSLDDKYTAVANICRVMTTRQIIIFCHSKKTISLLSEKMTQDGHAVAILSGDLTAEERISALDRFRAGFTDVLITTNVLAKGIYIEQVTIVVNFDLPRGDDRQANCEMYLHRIGKLGRFGKSGIAINLVDSRHARQLCKDMEIHFGKNISLLDANMVTSLKLDKPNAITVPVPSVKDGDSNSDDDTPEKQISLVRNSQKTTRKELDEMKNIEIKNEDSNSSLNSVKTFDDLQL